MLCSLKYHGLETTRLCTTRVPRPWETLPFSVIIINKCLGSTYYKVLFLVSWGIYQSLRLRVCPSISYNLPASGDTGRCRTLGTVTRYGARYTAGSGVNSVLKIVFWDWLPKEREEFEPSPERQGVWSSICSSVTASQIPGRETALTIAFWVVRNLKNIHFSVGKVECLLSSVMTKVCL